MWNIFGSPKEFVGEFRPPITPAMVAMNICKGKVTIAALSGFADLAFANIHGWDDFMGDGELKVAFGDGSEELK